MPVFGIVSLKGGVAKTTTAIHLAACAAMDGAASVTVLDADEERSACQWAAGGLLPFSVVPAERDRLARQVKALRQAHRRSVVIIDTPPNSRELLARAAAVADTVVVPVCPTGLDVNRLRPSLELLRDIEAERGRLKVAILFTRWDGRQILAREAQEALESFPVIDAKIRQLARYAQAFGERPTYLDEYAAVWRELRS